MSGSDIKTFADERLLASNLGISFFPKLSLWGGCQGKVYSSRNISKPQTVKFARDMLPRKKSVTLKKSMFTLGKLSTSRVYLGKKSVV